MCVQAYRTTGIKMKLIPCLHDEANMKQTSSKHKANLEHTSSSYTCILNTVALSLLHRVNVV